MPTITRTTIRNLTLLLGGTMTILAIVTISPVLPTMVKVFEDVPNADLLARMTLTLPALAVVISAPFIGVILDRLGRKPVLLISLAIYVLAGCAGYVLDSLPAILASRMVLGLAVAGVMSSVTTLAFDYFQDQALTRFMTLQGAFITFGGMIYLLIAGILADIDWRLPFLIYFIGAIVLVLAFITVDEPKRDAKQKRDVAEPQEAFPIRAVLPVYLTGFIALVLLFIFPVQLPFYLEEFSNATSGQTGLALSLQTFTSGIAALLYARIKGRFSFQSIYVLVFVALVFNHLIVAATTDYNLILIAMLVGGLGIGFFPANNNVWLASRISPSVRGRAVGGLTSVLFLGQFVVPFITQPLIDSLGMTGMFVVAGVVSFACAGVMWVYARKTIASA